MNLLETLPQFVDDEGKKLEENMLSLNIELKHMENKTKMYLIDLAFYPETCKTDFTLTCKDKYKNTKEFHDLVTEMETAKQTCINTLRDVTYKRIVQYIPCRRKR